MMGLVRWRSPSALIGLFAIIRKFPTMDEKQRTASPTVRRGGVVLHHVDQFQRQWITTVSWAIEGTLIWLFHGGYASRTATHRPRAVSGFIRLSPESSRFHRLSANRHCDPELASLCLRTGRGHWLFFGGKMVLPSDGSLEESSTAGTACCFGGILLFLLLNIQITDILPLPARPLHRLPFRRFRTRHDLQHRWVFSRYRPAGHMKFWKTRNTRRRRPADHLTLLRFSFTTSRSEHFPHRRWSAWHRVHTSFLISGSFVRSSLHENHRVLVSI
jgi:hypothetical protein